MSEKEIQSTDTTALAVTISAGSLAQLKEQRNQLKKFIKGELEKDSDFGTIPGTPKPCLYKPGAEKLANIFRLGSRIISVEKEVDFDNNRATYSTKIEVFHLASGVGISQCVGVCSSMEKKYKERAIYEGWGQNKRKVGAEPTPIGDLLNTLSKMSLKRAYVGAVILATGASGFFTQDLEDAPEEQQAQQQTEKKSGSSKVVKPKGPAAAQNQGRADEPEPKSEFESFDEKEPEQLTPAELAKAVLAASKKLDMSTSDLRVFIKKETEKDDPKKCTYTEMETVLKKLTAKQEK